MFPLTRYFSIASLVLFVIAFGLMFFRLQTLDTTNLVELREQNNISLTRAYSNSLLADHGDFIAEAQNMTVEDIMASPEFEALDAEIRQLTEGSNIIKVKIYAPNGMTVYSSEFEQIGEDKSENPGFLAGMNGETASELVYKDTFNAFEGRIEDIDIVESYVSIQATDSENIVGVIELYDDVTPLLTTLNTRRVLLGVAIATLFTILYTVLFFIVRYAENIMRNQRSQIETNVKEMAKANVELSEANARAEEATRLKSEFLSTMSHELRTPLNAIIGYSGIITSGITAKPDEKTLSMVQRIQDSGQHLLMLINNVLDISKIEAGRMTIVKEKTVVRDMTESLKEQLHVLAEKKNLEFAIYVDQSVPEYLVMDADRVKQILINLLSNGIKFTQEGSVKLDMSWKADLLTMRVSDTGVGIPPHSLEYIFDEFRQVDGSSSRVHEGTGLGLAIVRKFSEAMEGNVTVESIVNEGTTFTVNLPAEAVQEPIAQAG